MHSTAFTNVVMRRVIKPVVKEVTNMVKITTATRLLLKQLGIRLPVELNKMACGKVVSNNITDNINKTSTTNTKKAIRSLKVQALRINDFRINAESPLFMNTPYAILERIIHTRMSLLRLLVKLPKNHLMPSPLSIDLILEYGNAELRIHESNINAISPTAIIHRQ